MPVLAQFCQISLQTSYTYKIWVMDLILLGKAVILGVVEGLTEFLPISSTGHLILVGDLLNFNDDRGKAFEVIIQFGAILAVCWEFRAKHIKAVLFSPIPVASAFIIGALVIFWAERRQQSASFAKAHIHSVDDLSYADAFKVGLAQCAALIPGTSRSGATIIGGILFGIPRAVATEFSFFLAIPVIGGATAYELLKLWKNPVAISGEFGLAIVVGFIAAFISAFICVRWLIHYVAHHNFVPFAWYRIVFGVLVLISAYSGLVAWSH